MGYVCCLLHEHRAPSTLFSVAAFSQLQCSADCLPHEHMASFAQTQPPSRPQQVAGTAAVGADISISAWLGWVKGLSRRVEFDVQCQDVPMFLTECW